MEHENTRLKLLTLYDNEDELAKVCSALSVQTRRDIIKIISKAPSSVNEIAWKLNIPVSTASVNIKSLVDANILRYTSGSSKRGNEKLVSLNMVMFNLMLDRNPTAPSDNTQTKHVPIGSYTSYKAEPTCGINTPDGVLVIEDTPAMFSSPQRFNAGHIWLKCGYLEYKVPLLNYSGSRTAGTTSMLDKHTIRSICFRFELCSETAMYDHNCKSDITFSVNGSEACTFLSAGDFGEHRGRLNPDWHSDNDSQYGLLYSIDIRYDGTYLNEKRVSELAIEDLDLAKNDLLTFRIEVKPDAKHVGGFNLFGKTFGDYEQDIDIIITYQNIGHAEKQYGTRVDGRTSG